MIIVLRVKSASLALFRCNIWEGSRVIGILDARFGVFETKTMSRGFACDMFFGLFFVR